MDQNGRMAFQGLVEARIAEWERNITNLGHRVAKAKDHVEEIKEKVETMKSRLPVLTGKAQQAAGIPDAQWPDFKSEVDLIFENLAWLQNYVMRRIGAS